MRNNQTTREVEKIATVLTLGALCGTVAILATFAPALLKALGA